MPDPSNNSHYGRKRECERACTVNAARARSFTLASLPASISIVKRAVFDRVLVALCSRSKTARLTVARGVVSSFTFAFLPAGFLLGLLVCAAPFQTFAQRIAVLTPDAAIQSATFAERLSENLESRMRVIDAGVAASAFNSLNIENAFNLTTESAKRIGTVIGCDHYVIVKAATARRTSSARPMYFEAYAAIYLVNGRTGLLEHWLLESKHGDSASDAEKLLMDAAANIAAAIESKTKAAKLSGEPTAEFTIFDPDSKTMRPAMPYKRIKPDYTQTAYLYDVAATVDAEVTIDERGNITRLDIVRWAGYGLDEAVTEAIRKMNWRPGERSGKPLPMRVLLRYNFTKLEKE